MKRLTPQQRAQRYLAGRLPGDVDPLPVERAWLAGFKAGRRDASQRLCVCPQCYAVVRGNKGNRELRTELARTQTLLDGAMRVASVYKTEMQKLQRELGRDA